MGVWWVYKSYVLVYPPFFRMRVSEFNRIASCPCSNMNTVILLRLVALARLRRISARRMGYRKPCMELNPIYHLGDPVGLVIFCKSQAHPLQHIEGYPCSIHVC